MTMPALEGLKQSTEEFLLDPRGELMKYLEYCASIRSRNAKSGYTYSSHYEFLIKHGRFYDPRALPDGMWAGPPRTCYGNAIILGVKESLRYVEGISVSIQGVPIEHAWNTRPVGELTLTRVNGELGSVMFFGEPIAIDCTWEPIGVAYFGVEFAVERADDATWNGDASVLNDYQRKHPMFREPWHGEDWNKEWPRSPRLAHIRRNVHRIQPQDDAARIAERLRDILNQQSTFHVTANIVEASDEDVQAIRRHLTPEENARVNLRLK
jgi:hypothetical protein